MLSEYGTIQIDSVGYVKILLGFNFTISFICPTSANSCGKMLLKYHLSIHYMLIVLRCLGVCDVLLEIEQCSYS